jgi:hypothetical protein
MSFESRNEKMPEYPLHLRAVAAFFEYLPPPNTIRGMICYLMVFYCIRMVFKLGALLLARYIEENSTEGLRKRIEENRKHKEIEAKKLLDKLNNINRSE